MLALVLTVLHVLQENIKLDVGQVHPLEHVSLVPRVHLGYIFQGALGSPLEVVLHAIHHNVRLVLLIFRDAVECLLERA